MWTAIWWLLFIGAILWAVAPAVWGAYSWARVNLLPLLLALLAGAAGLAAWQNLDQAQRLCSARGRAPHGSAPRRHPATDGDRGRDHANAVDTAPSPSRLSRAAAPADANATGFSAILDALVEMRDSQLAMREAAKEKTLTADDISAALKKAL